MAADKEFVMDDDDAVLDDKDGAMLSDAAEPEEGSTHDTKMYYTVENEYAGNRLEDIYNPEDNYTSLKLRKNLSTAFDILVKNHDQYAFLRSIDVDKVQPGDSIYVVFGKTESETVFETRTGKYGGDYGIMDYGDDMEAENEPKTQCKICKIVDCDDELYVVQEESGRMHIADNRWIKPIDECLNKLKSSDIAFIYVNMRKYTKDVTSDIEFFDVFQTYFRINEKILYQSLPFNVQCVLLEALNKATGCFAKKNITPMW